MKDPIFILGAHKSGTTLIRNLLDGHTELFVIPIEPHPFQMMEKWLLYELRYSIPQKTNLNNAKKNLLKLIQHLSKTKDQKGGGVVSNKWDLEVFEKELFKIKAINTKEFIQQYVNAIHYCIYKNNLPDNLYPVEKSVTNTEYAIDLVKIFPKAKFLHIVRNPYANLVSIRKYKSKKKLPILKSAINSLLSSHYFLYRNNEIIENYLIVKYENLVIDLKNTMKQILSFLDIKNEEILFEPTSLGEPWSGNSVYNEKSFSVYDGSMKKWKNEITDLEIQFVNKYLDFYLNDFNYEKEKSRKNIFIPDKKERLKSYIVNRLFYKLN